MIHVSFKFLNLLQVMIEVVRQIKCPEGETIDPMVEVTVRNDKKFTEHKEGTTATTVLTWNEHLFYEPKNLVRYLLTLECRRRRKHKDLDQTP
jgi:hypothetical protein